MGATNRLYGFGLDGREERQEREHDLAAMAAHDLRGPLAATLGYLELLEKCACCSPSEHEILRRAEQCVHAASELVTSLLDLRRLEVGRMPMHRSECSLTSLVREAIETLVANPADLRRIHLRAAADVKVRCDGGLIRRVIGNLLNNALKFSPAGSIVEVGLTRGRGAVRVDVEDRGPGIPHRFRKHLFERFAQGEPQAPSRTSGVGLGLTFCKRAVEAHEGHLEVESRSGSGTRAWFELPLDASHAVSGAA